MLALINRILDWFKSLFWKEEMELTLVGLQYSGKTTFVNVIAVRESWISFISFVRVVLVGVQIPPTVDIDETRGPGFARGLSVLQHLG